MSTHTNAPEAKMPGGFRWLALAACAATYALVVVGGVVRATGSGDACPDWPRCHGRLLPPLEQDVLIEFSHRLLATVVGLLVLATAVVAWRSRRRVPMIVWGATAAVGLVIGQIVLGGVTVLNDLSAGLVMAHLGMAATLLATLLVVAIVSFAPKAAAVGDGASFRSLAAVAALATLALMLSGSYVSGSGAGLAFRDWPLFDGNLWPDAGRLAVIHATHRVAALLVGLLLAYVALQAWRTQRGQPLVVFGALLALVLYVAQAFVGAANIWTLLQPGARAAHLALAAALWATLVAVTALSHLALQPARAAAPVVPSRAAGAPAQADRLPAAGTVAAGGPS